MTLPFDTQQFFAVFAAYNAAIWPAQVVAYALGPLTVGALLLPHARRERVILVGLAILWAWNGLAYQLAFFAPINPAAAGFAVLFLLQALMLAARALQPGDVRFVVGSDWRSVVAFALIFYAALGYEALGILAGHGLMRGPLFGVAPCPTTIFTIGMLLLLRGRSAHWLSVIPLVWAAIGTSAAVLLHVPEDFGLGAAGIALAVALARRWATRSHPEPDPA